MRLVRLRLKNIASLKGEHEINFHEIQKESPLFAITGETGAGKSSILNAIGLALYGQIYKKNVSQLDVVTLGEKEGSIELIFQAKGKYYLADWKGKVRKQNGELYSTPQTPLRNLYELETSDFDSKKNIAGMTTAELINLDFDQFCKCVILNQGEFAKFLTSSFTERKDILEKLYPGELLESVGRELKLQLDLLNQTKNEVDIKLGELKGDPLSGERLKIEKEELKNKLGSLESTTKNLEDLYYHFSSLCSYFEKHTENEKKKEIIKADMALETTKYNHLLKTTEELLSQLELLKAEQARELPLLQTYLKEEETLRHLQESFVPLKTRIGELREQRNQLDLKLKLVLHNEQKNAESLNLSQSLLTKPLDLLKKAKPYFNDLFDLFSETELLTEEMKGKAERLSLLEITGKELKSVCDHLENALKAIPDTIQERKKELEGKKTLLQEEISHRQRAEIKISEIKKQIEFQLKEIKLFEEKILANLAIIKKTEEDLLPIEATLKLQEVIISTQICIGHALKEKAQSCPVCESPVAEDSWLNLKLKLEKTDLSALKDKFEQGSKTLKIAQQENEHLAQKIAHGKNELGLKEQESKELGLIIVKELLSLTDLDQELDALKEKAWKREELIKEENAKKAELQKIRQQYLQLKQELGEREKIIGQKEENISHLHQHLGTLVSSINKETIKELKQEAKNLHTYLELEALKESLQKEQLYLEEQLTRIKYELENALSSAEAQEHKINVLTVKLTEVLKGEKASDLIHKMNQKANAAAEMWAQHTEEQKKQELVLKNAQGRLYQLDDLTKDYDSHFNLELHQIRKHAQNNEIPELQKLKRIELSFSSPKELIIPLKDQIFAQKESYKLLAEDCRMNYAAIAARLIDWEKIQDKIQLLELQNKDIQEDLNRKMRLFEVLGKDELRTFVLSLVEENLIHQTNDELQKLCQGRYEIVHQTKSLKMTPEFFILDKYREGGRRKISTLSGGETFMVSLAMALGLAEMTRGQAEIDSLFIDEGFGTLDHESLEDVLDMLKQIQNRGAMIGIISHIKQLTQSLSLNLNVAKKSDGTSSISLIRN